jgi:hypothetical protein
MRIDTQKHKYTYTHTQIQLKNYYIRYYMFTKMYAFICVILHLSLLFYYITGEVF